MQRRPGVVPNGRSVLPLDWLVGKGIECITGVLYVEVTRVPEIYKKYYIELRLRLFT
jgi:hypothetical protein